MSYCRNYDGYEYDEPESKIDDQKTRNLFRGEYADIMVKVESDVYHLNKLKLALESDYFEKLFIENFQEKNADLVELSFIDSKTFSAIVEIIYEKNLREAINNENCIPVLMAMDYLQMEIDLLFFATFIEDRRSMKPMNAYIFTLYNLISQNQNFSSLLPSVFQYLSNNLLDFQGWEEFLTLPIEHFIKIICIRDYEPKFEGARKFVDFCVEWIWYDVENRLQRVLECVNAARRRFHFPCGVYDEKLIVSLQSQGSQEMKRETLAKRFYEMLMYNGKIKINAATKGSELTLPLRRSSYPEDLNFIENKRTKWARFLESGDLYDITVKVEEKTYKLHRMKLLNPYRGSGYFKELLKSERLAKAGSCSDENIILRTAIRPNKDEEYFLHGVDQKAFDWIVKYIYFASSLDSELPSELTSDNIIGVLNGAIILKICNLEKICFKWVTENIEQISWHIATEILKLTRGNDRFEGFHKLYFRKRVPLDWPAIGYNVPLFCSVSFEMLEEILVSETLPFEEFLTSGSSNSNFCIEDQNKLLDICSKWVAHDVKNRYHLIPRIALAINCNGMVDYDDYKMEFPTDSVNYSQQMIRNKLWDILCCTCLVPAEASSRKFENDPVFISKTEREMNFLNASMDLITSSRFFTVDGRYRYNYRSVLSATMVKDNVFILSEFLCFQVFNISSKNLISLARVPRIEIGIFAYDDNCTLLNCRDEIYCCFQSGCLFKYSIELNRWTKLSQCGSKKYEVRFASDGKHLYRIYTLLCKTFESLLPTPTANWIYLIDVYNFYQNKWYSLPSMTLGRTKNDRLLNLAFVNGEDLVASFDFGFYLFDKNSRCWINFTFPENANHSSMTTPTQGGSGNIAYVLDNKLFHLFGSNQNRNFETWLWGLLKICPYSCKNIVAIHRPGV